MTRMPLHGWKFAIAALLIGSAAFLCTLAAGLYLSGPLLPSFAEVQASYRISDALLLDRHGTVIHEMRVDPTGRRLEWVALADISPALARAVVAAEDRRFHDHDGVDWRALGVSVLRHVASGGSRGASTISMQLASRLDQNRDASRHKENPERKAASDLGRPGAGECLVQGRDPRGLPEPHHVPGRAAGDRRRCPRPFRQGSFGSQRNGVAHPGIAHPFRKVDDGSRGAQGLAACRPDGLGGDRRRDRSAHRSDARHTPTGSVPRLRSPPTWRGCCCGAKGSGPDAPSTGGSRSSLSKPLTTNSGS